MQRKGFSRFLEVRNWAAVAISLICLSSQMSLAALSLPPEVEPSSSLSLPPDEQGPPNPNLQQNAGIMPFPTDDDPWITQPKLASASEAQLGEIVGSLSQQQQSKLLKALVRAKGGQR